MKKFYVPFMLIFILFGCSTKTTEPSNTEGLSLENQITNVMSENNLSNKEIIDYDIKDNFIYVIFENRQGDNSYPDLAILKNNNGKLVWEAGPDDRTQSISDAMVFGRDEGSTVTLLLPNQENIKSIKVLGEYAKAVTYVEEVTDDFYMKHMYWIAYTNEEPTHEDIEIIME
ncbi:hypothetical protein [Bacillus suaedaesalsae]|uniref:Lipoprotein n=1 Tax=Bacillus suaedaesalsae TaxID=2810349 RepID=A0ABS2DFN5_9BACI|nr:hypothetical protein [Bacillus suaedaesalsae]MBM6617282.1 hypothetical protein [Bacillus suaedaesalsae]